MTEPTSIDRAVIAARLQGYLGQPAAAVDILSEALAENPGEIHLLRYRGHRRITLRDFDGAIDDLREAAAQIPDVPDELELYQNRVAPDAVNLVLGRSLALPHFPRVEDVEDAAAADYMTSLHAAIWYHLGVAEYVSGDLAAAAGTFARSFDASLHYEGKVASLDWQYMALRRLGRDGEAAALLDTFASVQHEWDAAGEGYDQRMRLYAGTLEADALRSEITGSAILTATLGYGLGNWYLYSGDVEAADAVFQDVLATGADAAFAYIAVESEIAGRGDLGIPA
ncbi:tetratricopeptide repeat protein [Litorihabitans aurantiacus]|uniref:Tetratricopeptide repeat protein n=1 Tax=Litorihabitans aurantiacus TaxID=1930061 RepID=A0AA37XCW0_9MICO|nr:tetratricopeptide repeat protein [Litorihabitans aurantiacus]GMA30405.1 hypothetical protein GCM10025875_03970 [Litorihabitans aurantiacus]